MPSLLHILPYSKFYPFWPSLKIDASFKNKEVSNIKFFMKTNQCVKNPNCIEETL